MNVMRKLAVFVLAALTLAPAAVAAERGTAAEAQAMVAKAIAAYDDVFDGAAKILIYEPATQGASTHAQLTQTEIVARVRSAKYDAEPIVDPHEALQRLNGMLESDDVVLLLSSGELGGLIKTIPKLAEQKYPSKGA